MNSEMVEQLKSDLDRFYLPREIANNGWIRDRKNQGNYFRILKLIRKGYIRAVNYSSGLKRMYKIRASDLLEYLVKYEGLES